ARLPCRFDLSSFLRRFSPCADRHARAAGQRVNCGCDFLRTMRLSESASPACLVRGILDLFRARLSHQRLARGRLPWRNLSSALGLLSGSPDAISRAVALGVPVDLLFD